MNALIMVSLNTEKYQQLVGELPNCYLKICMVEVRLPNNKLSQSAKRIAVNEYWIKAGGTGGYKQAEKLKLELFDFSIV